MAQTVWLALYAYPGKVGGTGHKSAEIFFLYSPTFQEGPSLLLPLDKFRPVQVYNSNATVKRLQMPLIPLLLSSDAPLYLSPLLFPASIAAFPHLKVLAVYSFSSNVTLFLRTFSKQQIHIFPVQLTANLVI